jgi:RecJ-like exonuclease
VVREAESRQIPTLPMNILKISIITAVIGIVALYIISTLLTEETVDIEELQIGQMERISGMVTSLYVSRDDHVFMKVSDETGEITVVAFESSNIDQAYDLEVGERVSVLGRVDEYEGDLEIIAKEIRKI